VATKTFPTVHLAGNTVQADRMITLGALEKMEEQTGIGAEKTQMTGEKDGGTKEAGLGIHHQQNHQIRKLKSKSSILHTFKRYGCKK